MNFMKCPINFGWAGQNVQFTFVQKGHWHALQYAPMRHIQVVTVSASPAVSTEMWTFPRACDHYKCKQMLNQDHTDSGPRIISESSDFKCIQLISQVFAELPFLNDNFQTNYNPRNLGVSNKWNTGCLQAFKRSLSHIVLLRNVHPYVKCICTIWFIEGVTLLHSFWTMKTSKQNDLYEWYAIHKRARIN